MQVLEYCLKVVNPTGSIGMTGVYMSPDPGAKGDATLRCMERPREGEVL
jgi:hypothetical protein